MNIKIPSEVIYNILAVYEFCDEETLKDSKDQIEKWSPNVDADLITDMDRTVYTTWSEVFKQRKKIIKLKKSGK